MSTVKTREEWLNLLKDLANLNSLKRSNLVQVINPLEQYDEELSEEEKTFDNLFEKAKSSLHDAGIDLQMESYTDAMKVDVVFLTASNETILSAMKKACDDAQFLSKNQMDFRFLMLLVETMVAAEEYEQASKPLNVLKNNLQSLELVGLRIEARYLADLISGVLVKIQKELYPEEEKAGRMHIMKNEIMQIAFSETREEREAMWTYAEMKKRKPQMIEAFELMLEISRLMREAEM